MSAPLSYIVGGVLVGVAEACKQAGNRQLPVVVPEVNDLIQAYRRGYIKVDMLNYYCRLNGVAIIPDDKDFSKNKPENEVQLQRVWNKIIVAGQGVPSIEDAGQLYLRGVAKPEDYQQMLQQNNIINPVYASYEGELLNEIPSSPKLISYSANQLFDPTFIDLLGLDKEQSLEIAKWQQANGIQWDLATLSYGALFDTPVTFARMDWWEHWSLPTVGQAEDMRHRLRTTIADPTKARDPSGLVADPVLLDKLLAVNNIPPGLRPAISAINYRPIGVRVLQGMSTNRTVPKTELTEILLDQGYTRYSADILTNYYWNRDDSSRLLKDRNELFADVIKAYELGIYSTDAAAVLLESTLKHNAKEFDDFNALAVPAQLAIANADPIVVGAIRHADLNITIAHVTKLIAQIKVKYEKFSYEAADARKALMQIGLTLDAANRHIDEWNGSVTVHHKELASSEVLKLYSEGIINVATAVSRLLAMGYSTTDAGLLISERQHDAAITAAKLAEATAQKQAAKAEAAARLALAHQQAAAKAAARAIKGASTYDLEKWYRRGIITRSQFGGAMAQLGWDNLDIVNAAGYIDSLNLARRKAAAKPAPAPKKSTAPRIRKAQASAILSWWGKGIITGADVDKKLADLGYSSSDISDMKQLEQTKPAFAGQP